MKGHHHFPHDSLPLMPQDYNLHGRDYCKQWDWMQFLSWQYYIMFKYMFKGLYYSIYYSLIAYITYIIPCPIHIPPFYRPSCDVILHIHHGSGAGPRYRCAGTIYSVLCESHRRHWVKIKHYWMDWFTVENGQEILHQLIGGLSHGIPVEFPLNQSKVVEDFYPSTGMTMYDRYDR